MTPEELAAKEAADKEAAKAKKADTFIDKVADRILTKQKEAKATETPPSRDRKPDPILDDTISGDQDLDEFMFGEKPAPTKEPVKP